MSEIEEEAIIGVETTPAKEDPVPEIESVPEIAPVPEIEPTRIVRGPGRPRKQQNEPPKEKKPVGRPRKTPATSAAKTVSTIPESTLYNGVSEPVSSMPVPQSPLMTMAQILKQSHKEKHDRKLSLYRSFLPSH